MFAPKVADTKYPWELEEKTVGGKIKVKYEPSTSQTPYNIELTLIGNAFTEAVMRLHLTPLQQFRLRGKYEFHLLSFVLQYLRGINILF